MATFFSIYCRETIALWTIQRGKIAAWLDLRPFIRASLPNEAVFRLDEPSPSIFEGDIADFEFNWEEIEKHIFQLQEPILAPGECLEVEVPSDFAFGYFKSHSIEEVSYGIWDHEEGYALDDLFNDPDPP